ncbi:ABC transporter substrate-binding protein [Paenibacillus sp. YIM B09110]|uniref:ABC transporter substrate-binding protein n=1 Tax=Paenibacillus sp. YIM B09110 TaxID=3126102 RepID=UPI00301CA086
MKLRLLTVISLTAILLVTGCSAKSGTTEGQASNKPAEAAAAQTNKPKEEAPPAAEPVTLSFYVGGGTLTDTEFKIFFEEPVKKKFPHITLNLVKPAEGVTPAEVLTSSDVPDIVYLTSGSYHAFQDLGVMEDLTPYIEKNNFDTKRLKPVLLDTIINFSKQGEIFTLPFSSNVAALFYNKDIFDKFGVPYPGDEQLTWEQALEIGTKLTRSDNGVNYIGIDVQNGPASLQRSYGIAALDPKTGLPALQSEQWQNVFRILKQNYDIPGFVQGDKYTYDRDAFLVDQNVAMRPTLLANLIGPLEELRAQGKPLNWDIAPIPNFSDNLGVNKEANVHSLVISSVSKHKDVAFQVLDYILSDEVQRIVARNGRVPAIVAPELEKEFGADIEVLKDKKIANIFTTQPSVLHLDPNENYVSKHLTKAIEDIALRGVDINTAARTAEDLILKELETVKKTK